MTNGDVKHHLMMVLERLSPDKATSVLDFATFLQQQVEARPEARPTPPSNIEDVWEAAIVAAEAYWFGLPESERRAYLGQTAAVANGRILDADHDRGALRRRVSAQYPNTPVLYVEGETEHLKPLIILSPHFGFLES